MNELEKAIKALTVEVAILNELIGNPRESFQGRYNDANLTNAIYELMMKIKKSPITPEIYEQIKLKAKENGKL